MKDVKYKLKQNVSEINKFVAYLYLQINYKARPKQGRCKKMYFAQARRAFVEKQIKYFP